MKTNIHFWSYLAQFFLEWKMFRTEVTEKLETHVTFSKFFLFEIRAVYEEMWKNIVEPGRPPRTIWCMRMTLWIPVPTDTHSEYVILIALSLQLWLHERASILRYTYIVCLVSV
jgi:hypothetical protein